MGRISFRDLKHRFENRRKSLSRLVLGTPIEKPSESFEPSSYGFLEDRASSKSYMAVQESDERKTEGAAFDTIVVEASDGSLHHSGEFTVAFEKWNSLRLGGDGDSSSCDDTAKASMAMKIQESPGIGEAWFRVHDADECLENDATAQKGTREHDPWEDLKPLLKEGCNPVVFCCIYESPNGEKAMVQFARASIWLWKVSDKVIISDIDGTLTKSNARGVLGTILTDNYDRVSHPGVCHLLSMLAISPSLHQSTMEAESSASASSSSSSSSSSSTITTTRVLYLTARPIHLANRTRGFLSGLIQQNGVEESNDRTSSPVYGLPQGPLLGFGGNLAKVLSMEVLSGTTQAFKAGELEKHVAGPFRRAENRHKGRVPFVAAFGNNLNDVQAYHKIGVDLDRIFLIDKNSTIVTFRKESLPAATRDDEGDNEEKEEFPPHSWYNDRKSTAFEEGYLDTKLHSFFGLDSNASV